VPPDSLKADLEAAGHISGSGTVSKDAPGSPRRSSQAARAGDPAGEHDRLGIGGPGASAPKT